MARLYQSGFELNSLTVGVEFTTIAATGASITTGAARSGTYGLRISGMSSATVAGVLAKWAASTTNGPYYFRTYFNVQTLPSAENRIIVLDGASGTVGSTARCYITIDQTGVLRLYTGTGPAQIGSASSALTTNTWYSIEMLFDNTGGAGADTLTARINGVNFATSSATTMPGGIFAYSLGGNLAAEAQTTGEWWFDDSGINDNTGTSQNSWLGEGKIIHLMPNAAGDNNMWLDNTGVAGTTNNYTLVDEAGTPNDATDYVESNTLNDIDDYNVTDSGIGASDVVNVVAVGQRASRSAGTNSSSADLRLKASSGGTVSTGTTNSATNGSYRTNDLNTTQGAPYQLYSYTKPGGAVAWTQADLDAMQIGIKLTVSGDRFFFLTTIWASIDYTPVSATTTSTSSTSSSTSTSSTSTSVSTSTSSTSTSRSTSTSSTSSSISTSSTSSSISTSTSSTSSSVSTSSTSSSISTSTSFSTSSTSQSTSTSKSTSTSSTSTSFSTSSTSSSVSTSTSISTSTTVSLTTSTSSTSSSISTSSTSSSISTSTSSTSASTSLSTSSTSSSTSRSTSTSSTSTSVSTSTSSTSQSTSTSVSTSSTSTSTTVSITTSTSSTSTSLSTSTSSTSQSTSTSLSTSTSSTSTSQSTSTSKSTSTSSTSTSVSTSISTSTSSTSTSTSVSQSTSTSTTTVPGSTTSTSSTSSSTSSTTTLIAVNFIPVVTIRDSNQAPRLRDNRIIIR